MLTYLALPHIPHTPVAYITQAMVHQEKYLAGAFEGGGSVEDGTADLNYTNRSVNYKGKTYKSRRQRRFPLADEFTQWCKENIDLECFNGSICTNEGDEPFHGPHIDPYRNYGLLYVVDTGGINVITSWWKKKDPPIMYSLEDFPPLMFEDYDNLELITSVSIKTGAWYIINTRILHSVENIEHRHITIQCSLNDASRLESAVLLKNNTQNTQ